MKVLDVNVLQSGMDDTITDIDNLQGRISALQRAVRDFAGLDDALSGKGGEAIRAFYDDCHQPFLIFLHQSLIDYQNTLTELKEAVETFEPDENGYVSQEFLENDVKSGLDDVKTTAIDFTSEANSVIGSVQDIVSIGKIDESEVVDNVQRGKDKADHIVDELNILDEYGVSQLEQTKQDLDTMLSYLTEIESKFQSGDLSIRNFDVKAIQGLESFQTIQDSIYNKNQETISGLYGDDFAKMPMSEIEKRKNTELKGLNDKGKTILNHAFKDLQEGNIDRKEYLNILKGLKKLDSDVKEGNEEIDISESLVNYINDNKGGIGSDVYGLLMAYDLHKQGFNIEKYETKGKGMVRYRVHNPEAIGISKPTKRDTKIYDRNHVYQQVRRGKHGDKIPIADKVRPKSGAISGLKSKAGWAGIAIDTGLNIKENIENEESTSRIIGDAGVDVGIGAVSLGVAGAATAAAIGIGGAPFIVGAIVGFGISTFISVGLNLEGKTGKSISKKLKDGVHSTVKTVAGWFK